MALIVKLLAHGVTNSGSVTGLYSVSAPKLGAIVDNLRFVNNLGSPVTVNLFVKPSTGPSAGSQIRLLTMNTSVPVNDILVVKPELTLGPSDAIEVATSAAMDYVISGVERT